MLLPTIKTLSRFAVVVFLSALLPAGVNAGSFFIFGEQSPKGLGTAGAGAAAFGTEDASTIYYNPAGMSFLEGTTVTAGFATLFPSSKFSNDGTNSAGFPTTGGTGGNGGVPRLNFWGQTAPSFYVSAPIGRRFTVGVGLNAPFALETDFDQNSVLRYQATNSRTTSILLNPSVAFKVTDDFSIGAGFDVQYAEFGLRNAIDFGLAGAQAGFNDIPGQPFGIFQPNQRDGRIRIRGNDIGFGFNAGVLYRFPTGTRLGLSYRHNIEFDLEGRAIFDNIPAPFDDPAVAGARFRDQATNAPLNLPASVSFSVYHPLGASFALLGDVTYTRWSSFDKVQIQFSDPGVADANSFLNYNNVFRFALGARYKIRRSLTLSAGVAYDESPIPDERRRTPRLPDSDRIIASVGVSYALTDRIDANVSYMHYFFADAPINNTNAASQTVRGSFENSIDTVSAGITVHFGGPPAAHPMARDNKSYGK